MPPKPVNGGALPPPGPAIAGPNHHADRKRHKAIRKFDKRAGERAHRVLNSLRRQNAPRSDLGLVEECDYDPGTCVASDDCGACDFAAVLKSKECRGYFGDLSRANPHILWTMLVSVSADWQKPAGRLGECRPDVLLETVAQRIRRTREGVRAIIGLDLSLNTAKQATGDYRYWAPHTNILLPLHHVAVVKDALASICRWAPLVPKPLKRRQVRDPIVAVNYALKFDLSAVRGRTQEAVPGKRHYRLQPFTSRISPEDFDEFIQWRRSFPMSDLMKFVGIGTSKGGWRMLNR